MKHVQWLGVIAAVGLAPVAGAVENTPITTPATAARSAVYLLEVPNTLTQQVNQLDYDARVIIERGFDQLDAATTADALLASPRGITVACALGGTLTARMTRGLPRIVHFEWSDCLQADLVATYTQNGPAEATLLEASFSPKNLYGIRLGDATRDHVESFPRPASLPYGERVVRRNQRFTGIIPQRMFDYENIPGRFTYELTGFVEQTQMLPDRNGGVASVELYPFVSVNYADHALVSRERDSGYDADNVFFFHEDIEFAWGALGMRIDTPQRPNKPPTSRTDEYRGLGLRIQNAIDGPANSFAFDGKIQVARNELFAFGCTAPDTFTYRTRVRPVSQPDAPVLGYGYAGGGFDVNGSTNLKFTALPPTDPNTIYASSQLDITSPGLAPASFTIIGFNDFDLRNAAKCAP